MKSKLFLTCSLATCALVATLPTEIPVAGVYSEAKAGPFGARGGFKATPNTRPTSSRGRSSANRGSRTANRDFELPSNRSSSASRRTSSSQVRGNANRRSSTVDATRERNRTGNQVGSNNRNINVGNNNNINIDVDGRGYRRVNDVVVVRPPGWRPPYYRPPMWRPPYWRPPYYAPPYYRAPHWYWGDYHYNPGWGWFFMATVGTATLVYVATLPEETECKKSELDGETIYICDGVLYRSTYYKDEQVYEVVSEPDEKVDG